jgi:hypothetical protein
MGRVLLSEMLRNGDILDNRLGDGPWLSWGLDHLWAHVLVLKELLILGHSDANKLDILLCGCKRNHNHQEREKDHRVDAVRDTLLGKLFVNGRHPINKVLSGHVWILWASFSLKLVGWS